MKDRRIDSLERLKHIRSAIGDIERFVSGKTENDFLEDDLLQSALLYQFSVIGEAVVHIDDGIIDKYSYPWYKVRAFRNLISHEYFNIRLEAVWEIIDKDLPGLKSMIDTILKEEF